MSISQSHFLKCFLTLKVNFIFFKMPLEGFVNNLLQNESNQFDIIKDGEQIEVLRLQNEMLVKQLAERDQVKFSELPLIILMNANFRLSNLFKGNYKLLLRTATRSILPIPFAFFRKISFTFSFFQTCHPSTKKQSY